jgi:outer membrane lipoprotein-sorting protein
MVVFRQREEVTAVPPSGTAVNCTICVIGVFVLSLVLAPASLAEAKGEAEEGIRVERRVSMPVDPALAAALKDLIDKVAQSTSHLKDLSFTVKVVKSDSRAIRRIRKDFAPLNGLRSASVCYKRPDKVRIEARVGMATIVARSDGSRRKVSVTPVSYSKQEAGKEASRTSLLDAQFGLLTETIWQNYDLMSASKTEKGPDCTCQMRFATGNQNCNSHVCHIDLSSMKLLKVDQCDPSGNLQTRYVYSDHQQVCDDFWVPGRVDIYNSAGDLAVSAEYQDVKANTGLPDSLF